MLSNALLSVMSSASCCLLPCVFHMDFTFECSENEFLVILLGISDAQRQFHLLTICVVFHHILLLIDFIPERASK
jgi:hypothetical protein